MNKEYFLIEKLKDEKYKIINKATCKNIRIVKDWFSGEMIKGHSYIIVKSECWF